MVEAVGKSEPPGPEIGKEAIGLLHVLDGCCLKFHLASETGHPRRTTQRT